MVLFVFVAFHSDGEWHEVRLIKACEIKKDVTHLSSAEEAIARENEGRVV